MKLSAGAILVIALGLCTALLPSTASAAPEHLVRETHDFDGYNMRTRGYLHESCIIGVAPCRADPIPDDDGTHSGKFQKEYTAQARAIGTLMLRHGSFDRVHWEVGPLSNAYRMDIVVEHGLLFDAYEVKRWGAETVTSVRNQLTNYINWTNANYPGRTPFRPGTELSNALWSMAYVTPYKGVGCAWADPVEPGIIWFEEAALVPPDVRNRTPGCTPPPFPRPIPYPVLDRQRQEQEALEPLIPSSLREALAGRAPLVAEEDQVANEPNAVGVVAFAITTPRDPARERYLVVDFGELTSQRRFTVPAGAGYYTVHTEVQVDPSMGEHDGQRVYPVTAAALSDPYSNYTPGTPPAFPVSEPSYVAVSGERC